MSFVISVYVREGIVMASDSRLTMTNRVDQGNQQIHNIAVGQSDSNYKTFLTPSGVGISTYGNAMVAGAPIGGYVESFIEESSRGAKPAVACVAESLLLYFRTLDPGLQTYFYVAGYQPVDGGSTEQQVWSVDIARNSAQQVIPNGTPGAIWGGESDVLARLVNPMFGVDQNNQPGQRLPDVQIPFPFFTLQDAIDFSVFAVRSTIDSIRFQPRAKTVGGPIDVLIIKPSGAHWVQRKELTVG